MRPRRLVPIRVDHDAAVIEYNRGRAVGEFPSELKSPAMAVVDYGAVKLVCRLTKAC
jgi:hypothetical protein